MGGEGGEVGLFAGGGPGLLAERRGLGFAGDEVAGKFGGAVEFAAHGGREGGCAGLGLRGGEGVAPGAGSPEFVGFFREPGELVGAPGVTAVGQVGFLVPVGRGGGAGDDGPFAGEEAEVVEGGGHGRSLASGQGGCNDGGLPRPGRRGNSPRP